MAKALFFDIDGTLIDTFGAFKEGTASPEIPQSTIDELHRLQSAGHKLFIASGRPLGFINDVVTRVGFDGYVLFNGGYVEMDGEPIFRKHLGFKTAVLTAEVLDGIGAEYMIEARDVIYIEPRFSNTIDHFSRFLNGNVRMETHFDRGNALRRCIKLEADFSQHRPGTFARLWNTLGAMVKIDENGTGNHAEFYSREISKAVGIQKILDRLKLAREDCYAFGDGLNDLEMLEFAGCGVAMGNGAPEVKAVADLIAPPVNEDGMARVLRELFPA